MNYWIIKSEPHTYSIDQLKQDKNTSWTGVRNYQARNNLRLMKVGDMCLYYHSGDEKQIVGIAKVVQEASPDPTAPGEDWVTVEMGYVKKMPPVTLKQIKNCTELKDMLLVRHSRLSVLPVKVEEYETILSLSQR